MRSTVSRRALTSAVAVLVVAVTGAWSFAQESDPAQSEPQNQQPRPKQPVWLGVYVDQLPDMVRHHLNLPANRGVMVANVVRESPAESQLQQHDVITQLNGQSVSGEPRDFIDAIARQQVGDVVRLTVLRGGAEQTIEVKLAARPAQVDAQDLVFDGGEDDWLNGFNLPQLRQLEQLFGPGQGIPNMEMFGLRRDGAGNLQIDPQIGAEVDRMMRDLQAQLRDQLGDVHMGGQWLGDENSPLKLELNIGDMPPGQMRRTAIINRNGRSMRFEQTGEKVAVTIDGERKDYDTLEAFKQADPEHYAIFEQSFGQVQIVQPKLNPPAVERPQAQPEIPDVFAVPAPNANANRDRERSRRVDVRVQEGHIAEQPTFSTSTDGEITVELRGPGGVVRQSFRDLDELTRKAPKLAEQYRTLNDDLMK